MPIELLVGVSLFGVAGTVFGIVGITARHEYGVLKESLTSVDKRINGVVGDALTRDLQVHHRLERVEKNLDTRLTRIENKVDAILLSHQGSS